MIKRTTKRILTGYRAEGVKLYRTNLKPLGYVVAGLGFMSLGVAVIPNGLGFVAYPLGFALLGAVGIKLDVKKKAIYNLRLFGMRRGWI